MLLGRSEAQAHVGHSQRITLFFREKKGFVTRERVKPSHLNLQQSVSMADIWHYASYKGRKLRLNFPQVGWGHIGAFDRCKQQKTEASPAIEMWTCSFLCTWAFPSSKILEHSWLSYLTNFFQCFVQTKYISPVCDITLSRRDIGKRAGSEPVFNKDWREVRSLSEPGVCKWSIAVI